MGCRRTRSKSDLPARLVRVLGRSLPVVSAFILKAPQTTMSAKVSLEERSPSTPLKMRHLWRHKILLWATSYYTERQAARLISTEWPANGSRWGTLGRGRSWKGGGTRGGRQRPGG